MRLGAKRGIITLIATTQQYILAEATQTLSLIHDGAYDRKGELWFGNAAILRSQGVSENALCPDTVAASNADGTTYATPALIIEDMASDERFKSKAYAGNGVSFCK